MKYILLIQQGTTPTPNDQEAWGALSQEEQGKIYAAYKALNETPGVTSGVHMQPAELFDALHVFKILPVHGTPGGKGVRLIV